MAKKKPNKPAAPAPAAPGRRMLLSVLLVNFGLLLIMAGAALPLAGFIRSAFYVGTFAVRWFGIPYALGAVMLFVGRILGGVTPGASIRLKRLHRMELWTSLIFIVGAVFIFLPQAAGNDWIAFTMAGGVLTLFTSIMIPRQQAKETPQK